MSHLCVLAWWTLLGFVWVGVRDWTFSTLSVNNKDFIESVVQLLVQAVRVRSIWGFEAVVSPVFGFLWSRWTILTSAVWGC